MYSLFFIETSPELWSPTGKPQFLAGSIARPDETHSQTAAVVHLECCPDWLLNYKSGMTRSPCHIQCTGSECTVPLKWAGFKCGVMPLCMSHSQSLIFFLCQEKMKRTERKKSLWRTKKKWKAVKPHNKHDGEENKKQRNKAEEQASVRQR